MRFILESDKSLPFYHILMDALEYKAVGMMQEFVLTYESADAQWRNVETPKFLTDLGEILAVRNSVIYGRTEWNTEE
jgi:heat shock protein HspQ